MQHVRVEEDHWIWIGYVRADGYGGGKGWGPAMWETLAHRISYALFVEGPIPKGTLILHKHEGMKLCVRPDCLKPGNQVENMGDFRKAGGLHARNNKLTPEMAIEIRDSGLSIKELASKFGLSTVFVGKIRNRQAWKDADRAAKPDAIWRKRTRE